MFCKIGRTATWFYVSVNVLHFVLFWRLSIEYTFYLFQIIFEKTSAMGIANGFEFGYLCWCLCKCLFFRIFGQLSIEHVFYLIQINVWKMTFGDCDCWIFLKLVGLQFVFISFQTFCALRCSRRLQLETVFFSSRLFLKPGYG